MKEERQTGAREMELRRFKVSSLKGYSVLPSHPTAFPNQFLLFPEWFSANPPSSSPDRIFPFLKHFLNLTPLPILSYSSTEFTGLPLAIFMPELFFFPPQPLLALLACPKAQSLNLFSIFTLLQVFSSTFLASYTS